MPFRHFYYIRPTYYSSEYDLSSRRIRSRFFHQNCTIVEYNKYLFKIDIFVGQISRKPGYFIHRLISPEFSPVTKPRYDPERVGQRLVSWESTLGARAFPRYNARAWTKRTTAHARRILTNGARVEILRSSPDQRARNYSYDLSLIIDAPTRDISRARGKFLP